MTLEIAAVNVFLGSGRRRQQVLHDVSLSVASEETVALVGESGSGKSTLARVAVGLVRPTTGTVQFCGRHVEAGADPRLQLMFQGNALDPLYTVHRAIGEASPHGFDDVAARSAVEEVGLDPNVLTRHPNQLSGGQRQRVNLARALAARPALLILDEPLSALDVVTQAQIVHLLGEIKGRTRLAYVFITHDLVLARRLAERIVVMQSGRVVEEGPATEVLDRPSHGYTRRLVDAASALSVPFSRPEQSTRAPRAGQS